MSAYYYVIAYVGPDGEPESYVVRHAKRKTAEWKRSARAASDDFFALESRSGATGVATPFMDDMFDSIVRGKGTFRPADVYFVLAKPKGRVAWETHMNFLDGVPRDRVAFDAASIARQVGAKKLYVFGREIKL